VTILLIKAAEAITIPVLVVHDNQDYEVPVKAGIHIYQHLQRRIKLSRSVWAPKILGDEKVIEK
jgi:esterase/lipase